MGILARLDAGDPTHRIVEAVKQAFLDRHLIADPDMVPVDCTALLSPARLQAKAAAIRAALLGGWVSVLITDEEVAESLIVD